MALDTPSPDQAQQQQQVADGCGVNFVKEYYAKYAGNSESLKVMYSEQSVLYHHSQEVQAAATRCMGLQQIHEFLRRREAERQGTERKVSLGSLECHPSLAGSVMVLVKGTILMRRSSQDFSHAFLLAKDAAGRGYYIHNDCMELSATVPEAPAAAAPAAPASKSPPRAQQAQRASPRREPAPQAAAPPAASPPRAARSPKTQPDPVEPAAAQAQQQQEPQEEQQQEEQQDADEEPAPAAEEAADADADADAAAPAEDGGEQSSSAPMSWARIAGSKGGASPPAAKPKPQPKPAAVSGSAVPTGGAEPPKAQPAAAPPPQAKEAKKAAEAEVVEVPKGPMSWAGLVSSNPGSNQKQTPQQGVQRVAGGKIPARDYEQKPARDEDGTPQSAQSPAPQQRAERQPRAAAPGAGAPADRKSSPAAAPNKYQYAALYVSKLPGDMKEGDIDTVFGVFGNIMGKTFRAGQYCFIDYDDASAVKKALDKHDRDGVYFRQSRIMVAERKSPEQRAKEREQKGQPGGKGRGTVSE